MQTERAIVRDSVCRPEATARHIQAIVGGPAAAVSVDTVMCTLRRHGRVACRPTKSPALSRGQMSVRFAWARQHRDWTISKWKSVSNALAKFNYIVVLMHYCNLSFPTPNCHFVRLSSQMRRLSM